MPDPLTRDEARERLHWFVVQNLTDAEASEELDNILTTTDALAALVTWPALLKAGEKAGKVKQTHRCTGCDNPPTVNHVGYESWRLTNSDKGESHG